MVLAYGSRCHHNDTSPAASLSPCLSSPVPLTWQISRERTTCFWAPHLVRSQYYLWYNNPAQRLISLFFLNPNKWGQLRRTRMYCKTVLLWSTLIVLYWYLPDYPPDSNRNGDVKCSHERWQLPNIQWMKCGKLRGRRYSKAVLSYTNCKPTKHAKYHRKVIRLKDSEK